MQDNHGINFGAITIMNYSAKLQTYTLQHKSCKNSKVLFYKPKLVKRAQPKLSSSGIVLSIWIKCSIKNLKKKKNGTLL